jgi:alpha-glucosidase (family GH31 glycosyl hydrolase)
MGRSPRLLLVLLAFAMPARAVEPPDVTVLQHGSKAVRVETGVAAVDVSRTPLRLKVRDRVSGRRLLRGARGGTLAYERGATTHVLGEVTAVTPLADGVVLEVATDEGMPATVTVRFLTRRTVEVTLDPPDATGVGALRARFLSPRREAIYGLTERLRDSPPLVPGVIDIPADDVNPPEVGSLDRRGETVEMRVLPTFSVYAPFYQSSEGYGLAVAGTTFGAFDVAKTDPQVVSFRFETGTTPASRRLVFDVFVGPDHATILDEYTYRNGRPIVPPDWAFLHWRWRDELVPGTATLDGNTVNAQLAEDVLMYDALGIPPGVYLFDRPVLAGNYGFAQWAWDTTRLPNPDLMLQSLKSRGYRVITWSSLWTCGNGPLDNGTEAQALGYHVPGPLGAPNCADVGGVSFILDPTNPAAAAWWRDKIAAFVSAYDLDGIKLDRGEEHIPSEATDVWADGRSGREVRNDYPTLQAKIHHDALALARPGGDFLLTTRAGYTGTAQYSTVWGGDIPGSTNFGGGPGTDLGLRSAIVSQLRAAFLGFPIWGSDTGGYYQFKDREVFARWIEFSAFSGIMEIGGHGTHAPWDMPTAPAYDTEMIDIYRRFAALRQTLQPYVVAAAADAATGMPIVRPMPFESRKDRRLRNLWDQYLFGPDLLVAPVWRVGERSRTVYFPRGTWRSYWNPAEAVVGPKTVAFDVPLDQILVFVRDGAVVPGP